MNPLYPHAAERPECVEVSDRAAFRLQGLDSGRSRCTTLEQKAPPKYVQADTLRVLEPNFSGWRGFRRCVCNVDVPEPFTEFVKVGAEADLTVGQVAGRKFAARVVGTAGAINQRPKDS
jgi:hypothetical protein